MINLRTITVLTLLLFFSCNKQLDESGSSLTTIETQVVTGQESSIELIETELENVFKNLDETNLALGSMIMGLPIVDLYDIYDPKINPLPDPVIGTEKKFKFNILGIRSAVKYAGEIMEKGGCIKAWLDGDNMINVEEIPC